MRFKQRDICVLVLMLTLFLSGCKTAGNTNNSQSKENSNSSRSNSNNSNSSPTTPGKDDIIQSGTGVEKAQPASGKSNVQGKVFYNEKPVENIEVKLCEKFNQYIGGCKGETFAAKTDSEGEYLFKDVHPRIYEGLTVRVFNTNSYIFATSGYVGSAKYNVEADKTFFAPNTNLFKLDLKLMNPKAGAKIGGNNIEVKWDEYADAAYYKFSIFADSSSGAKTELDYVNKRVDGASFTLDKPLSPGAYSCKVEAFNSNNIKLAESSSDIKFTVTANAK